MTQPQDHTPRGWTAVPGTTEKAPILDIVVLVVSCALLLAGAVGTVCGFFIGLAGVL